MKKIIFSGVFASILLFSLTSQGVSAKPTNACKKYINFICSVCGPASNMCKNIKLKFQLEGSNFEGSEQMCTQALNVLKNRSKAELKKYICK